MKHMVSVIGIASLLIVSASADEPQPHQSYVERLAERRRKAV